MSYTALYRKYRPSEFEDVKGQDPIVATLKNQIVAGRIGHAYLFCGTRGTGKTTVAKIFAKAVNCEAPVDGSPCGTCASCRAIKAGVSMNVIEIDAASNNGVENIRQIKEEVAYSPTEGKYKVYIIDEVHMLSIGAFNALLKTLEEPPEYVIFILATTESHKIPVTILSRCQRYDFRRISIETIAERLIELMESEEISVEDRAIRYIAKAADGSMRDALSLLDQCTAFFMGQSLTYDNVLEVLGAVDTEVFSRLLRILLEDDASGSIQLVEELIMQGRELGQFLTDFIWYLRNLLLLKTSFPQNQDPNVLESRQMEEVLDLSSEGIKFLKEDAARIDSTAIMRYIRIFSDLSAEIKYSPQKRVLAEIALIKLCNPEMDSEPDAYRERISQLEKAVMLLKQEAGSGQFASVPGASVSGKEPGTGQSEPQKTAVPKAPIPKAIPEDVKLVVKNWRSIIQGMPGTMRSFLKTAHLSLGGENKLMLVFDDDLAYTYVSEETHKAELVQTIRNRIQKEIDISICENENKRPFEQQYVDLEKIINMEIEIEEM